MGGGEAAGSSNTLLGAGGGSHHLGTGDPPASQPLKGTTRDIDAEQSEKLAYRTIKVWQSAESLLAKLATRFVACLDAMAPACLSTGGKRTVNEMTLSFIE